jgi:hypothetical protein
MTAPRRTWWAKLERADRHLAEFKREFERLRDTRISYEVTTDIHHFQAGDMLEAHAVVPEVYRDDIAAIVGDVVFNTRSALDHLCVALSGNERSEYPIYEEDIWAPWDLPGVKDPNTQRRKDFNGYTRGMPAAAVEFIKTHQPFAFEGLLPARLRHLAILNRLSNADKHRRLVAFDDGICQVEVMCTFDGVKVPNAFVPGDMALSGAVIGVFPVPPPGVDVQIRATGGLHLTLMEPNPPQFRYETPDSLVNLVQYVRKTIVEPLDGFIPYA